MIYHLSLKTAGIIAGLLLLGCSLPGLLMPGKAREWLVRLPRSFPLGIALLTIAFLWSFWLLATWRWASSQAFVAHC